MDKKINLGCQEQLAGVLQSTCKEDMLTSGYILLPEDQEASCGFFATYRTAADFADKYGMSHENIVAGYRNIVTHQESTVDGRIIHWPKPFTIEITAIKPPPTPAGYWILGQLDDGGFGTQFSIYKKPSDDQIRMTEIVFGWKWKDHKC